MLRKKITVLERQILQNATFFLPGKLPFVAVFCWKKVKVRFLEKFKEKPLYQLFFQILLPVISQKKSKGEFF